MFNKKYKKGMADAAKAYQEFGRKQEDALNHILEEVRQGKASIEEAVDKLGGNIDNLYEHLRAKEKARLYTVYTPFDIKQLGKQEQLFLAGALFELPTISKPNENQKNYMRAIQKYLDIKDLPSGTDLMAVENIEDVPTQKAIYQAVLEYLRLQDGDYYDEVEGQQDFLDAFSLSKKARNEIAEHVERLYIATGAQGLAEKYGYVPEEDSNDTDAVNSVNSYNARKPFESGLKEELADKIIKDSKGYIRGFVETENFCFYCTREGGVLQIRKLYKKSGDITTLYITGASSSKWIIARKSDMAADTLVLDYEDDASPSYSHLGTYNLLNNMPLYISRHWSRFNLGSAS